MAMAGSALGACKAGTAPRGDRGGTEAQPSASIPPSARAAEPKEERDVTADGADGREVLGPGGPLAPRPGGAFLTRTRRGTFPAA